MVDMMDSYGLKKVRVYEEQASLREIIDLSPPQALDRAEYFLVGQGYVVVQRTATTLTVERAGPEGAAGQQGAPKVVVMAVPQPDGGVRIKVRGSDREGMRERQARWSEWEAALPKRLPPPKVRTKVVKVGESRRGLSRLSRTTAILVASLLALLVVVGLVVLAIWAT